MRTFNGAADLVHCQFGSITPFFRFTASPQPGAPELNALVRSTPVEGLRIGIGADEFNALDAALNHVTDRIATASPDADHLDLGALVELLDFNHFNAHWESPVYTLG